MIDPNDLKTIALGLIETCPLPLPSTGREDDKGLACDQVEACKKALSGADRARRYRKKQKQLRAQQKAEGVRMVALSERDRSYLGSALDYYEYQQFGGGHSGKYVKENLLDLYQRIDPPHRETAAWPKDEDRDAWYSKQIWHGICSRHEAKVAEAEAVALAARDELARSTAEVERLKALLQQVMAEVGVSLPAELIALPISQQSSEPVIAEPEPFSLTLMRRHRWKNSREEEVALVAILVVPHEGRWMWSVSISSSNGNGVSYAALPKWGKFAGNPAAALQMAISEVKERADRVTAAELARIEKWLSGEVASSLARLIADMPDYAGVSHVAPAVVCWHYGLTESCNGRDVRAVIGSLGGDAKMCSGCRSLNKGAATGVWPWRYA